MKKKYVRPDLVVTNLDLADKIAAPCWQYSGSELEEGCMNYADMGDPSLCIPGWTEGNPSLGTS